jgi:hypothetical protein
MTATTTFKDLNDKLISARYRKEVLMMLISHIENNFRSVGGQVPKNSIKMDSGAIIPESVFEEEVEELTDSVHALDVRIQTIEASILQPVQVVQQPAAPVVGTAPVPTPEPSPQPQPPPAPPVPVQQETPPEPPKRRGRPRKVDAQ